MKTLESGPESSLTPAALERLFQAFSRTSREIERSHAELQAKVVALRRELAEKDRRLEQKKRLEALGLVVAGVAHEFRNPLGSLSLYLDCLGEIARRLPDSEAREASVLIGKIEMGVRHLNAVVEDMLIFTRPPASPDEPCDLPRLVEEALLLLRGDIESSRVRCEVEANPGLPAVEGGAVVPGDRDQTVRILVNVLKNAIQAVAEFRAAGEGLVRISLRPATERGGGDGNGNGSGNGQDPLQFIEVEVRDNGPGVPPERLDRLSVPFYTEKRKGIGLGLSIVQTLMERQGGRVELGNCEGGGFQVRLLFQPRAGAGEKAAAERAGKRRNGENGHGEVER